ncbi:MAG TPA: hypothetical protein VF414_22075, partial [Thermoanaerobaculia bacterium]
MSRLSEREIARRLAEPLDAEPPEGLLEKIKAEIPPVVEVGTRAPGGEVRQFPLPAAAPPPRRQRWLIAASLAVMVLGGLLAWQLQFQLREEGMEMEAPRMTETWSGSGVPEGDAAYPPPPPPPPAVPLPPASRPAPAEPRADSEATQLRRGELESLGYLGPREEVPQ